MIAAISGEVQCVRELINHGASIGISDDDNDTALTLACYHNSLEVAELLLDSGANVDENETLFAAAQEGNFSIVQLLLKRGATVDMPRQENGATALWAAAGRDEQDVVALLIGHGASLGAYPLHRAAARGHLGMVKQLVARHGASIFVPDLDGDFPTSLARQHGHDDVADWLSAAPALSPLHLAVELRDVDRVRALLQVATTDVSAVCFLPALKQSSSGRIASTALQLAEALPEASPEPHRASCQCGAVRALLRVACGPWAPAVDREWPAIFRAGARAVLLVEQRLYTAGRAALLPKECWLHALSFCARDWFVVVGHECAGCGAAGASHRCSRCKAVNYCSRDCQRKHWKSSHKKECSAIRTQNTFISEANL
jgi:hypothetical protein